MTDGFDLDRLRTLNRLVDEALAMPASERTTWLDRLSTDYDAFKPRLKVMLDELDAPAFESFLDALPALEIDADEVGAPAQSFEPGVIVGAYRLVRLLARGGQAVVWVAERADGVLDRTVALKLPIGVAHRPGLAERLARERDILARLEHPHIARLYDAGVTAAGEPFLAMELVDGQPIDAWVTAQALDARAIVRLVLQVAGAVAYAHSALVIHRDLKPSNVLVDVEGRVRLLDFGIAALVDAQGAERDGLTADGGRALTLAYASPEQVERRPLGVATDVYSLAVLTYELLTGRRPYVPARDTAGALEEAILRDAPALPSRMAASPARRRALAGDLDTILLKALRKESAGRYDSVAAFADDLRRWLDGQPVQAQPDRALYRARKFIGRHRVAAAAAAAVLTAVVAGSGVAAWQARQARAAQRQSDSVTAFLATVLRDADLDAPESASDLRVIDLLKRAHRQVATLEAPADVRIRLLNLLGDALAGYGDAAEFAAVTGLAVATAAPLPPGHPEALQAQLLQAQSLMQRGRGAEATAALAPLTALLDRRPELVTPRLIRAYRFSADAAIGEARQTDAVAAARRAVAQCERVLGPTHPETASSLRTLAQALAASGNDEALAMSDLALERTLAAHQAQPRHPWILRAREQRAEALGNAGDLVAAVAELERALALKIDILGADALGVGHSSHNLAGNLYRLGRFAEAERLSDRAYAILGPRLDHAGADYVNGRNLRALIMIAVRRGDDAVAAIEEVQAAHVRLLGAGHPQVLGNRALVALGHGYAGRVDIAAHQMAAVLADMRTAKLVLPAVHVSAGRLEALRGRRQDADRHFAAAETAAGTAAPAARLVAQVQGERAMLLAVTDGAAGRPALEQALARLDALYPVATPFQADLHVALARLDLAAGRPSAAQAHTAAAAIVWQALVPDGSWAAAAATLQRRAAAPAASATR